MRYIAALLFFISFGSIQAQTAPPNGMLYQAIARDASGNLAAKRTIYVQTTVRRTSATGTVMYSDEHKVNSNADAMFTVIVGQGKFLSGTYSKLTDIPWGNDKYFFNLKICVAPTLPGTGWKPSYTDMGTTQFWSVPYAMFSGKSADSLSLTIKGTGRQIKLGNYRPIFFSVADNDSVATNEIQTLSRTGGRLMLSLNGGMVSLPDSSATNELQTITRNGGRISLSLNGGTITLPDSSATNELQTISKTGSTVTLSQGGGSFTDDDKQTLSVSGAGSTKTLSVSNGNSVQINVNDGDTSSSNEIQSLSRNGGRINLSLGGGTVLLPDSSASNELQNITRTGGRIILNQGGGTVTLPDSSAWNEIQRLTITNSKGTIMLNNGGGNIRLADSSSTNELQTISQSGNTITLSNGGGSVTITDNDKQQLGITTSKGTITLGNGGSVQLADSSSTNEIQSLSISSGKGRILLSDGGNIELSDSSSSNELQSLSRTGGRIILNQNGGVVTLPDSSATNELQTLSQSGNTITLSNGGGSATITDNDNQQLGITSGKGTITLGNGGSVQLADSSATNEIQSLSISAGKGRISLSNGGSVLLNDSSASNELQSLSRTGGRIILNQNGGDVTLPDSSATNELQTLSQSGNTITLSNGGGSATITDNDEQQLGITTGKGTITLSNGGSVQLADSSDTNEIQELTISNDSIFLSKNGYIKLPEVTGRIFGDTVSPSSTFGNIGDFYLNKKDNLLYGPKTNTGWGLGILLKSSSGSGNIVAGNGIIKKGDTISFSSGYSSGTIIRDINLPDGLANCSSTFTHNFIPYFKSYINYTYVNYQVPKGKNLYITETRMMADRSTAGLLINSQLILSATTNCTVTPNFEPTQIIVGENMTVDAALGGNTCGWIFEFKGFLVDKKVDIIYQNSNYTVPSGFIFVNINKKGGYPNIYKEGAIVGPLTNGYVIPK